MFAGGCEEGEEGEGVGEGFFSKKIKSANHFGVLITISGQRE